MKSLRVGVSFQDARIAYLIAEQMDTLFHTETIKLNTNVNEQYIRSQKSSTSTCFERDAHIKVSLHRERLHEIQSQRHQPVHPRSLFSAVYGDNRYCAPKVRKTGEKCPTAGLVLPDLESRG